MKQEVTGVIVSIIILATVTALVLPNHATPQIAQSMFNVLSRTIGATVGRV